MLVEGAIRFVRQAELHFAENNEGHANTALLRAMSVVEEMIVGVKHDDSEINTKLTQLYEFLYRSLTSCYVNADREKLADVVRILEFQRETWQLASERATAASNDSQAPAARPVIPPTPHAGANLPSSGMSLEA